MLLEGHEKFVIEKATQLTIDDVGVDFFYVKNRYVRRMRLFKTLDYAFS
jgi:hypothetical protein